MALHRFGACFDLSSVIQPDENECVRVGLGRVELPTSSLGKQGTVLTGFESFGLYYIVQADTTLGI
jgi:hypothetical protein